MRWHAVLLALLSISLQGAFAPPPDTHVFDGLHRVTRTKVSVHMIDGSEVTVGGVMDSPNPKYGCGIDGDLSLLLYCEIDGSGYPHLYRMNLDRLNPNEVPVKIVKFATRKQGISAFAVDFLAKNIYVSYSINKKTYFKKILDYTGDLIPPADVPARVPYAFDALSTDGNGGAMVVIERTIYLAHSTDTGRKVLMTNSIDTPGTWAEVSDLSADIGAEHKVITMVSSPHPKPTLYISAVPTTMGYPLYPGDMYKVDPAGVAAVVKYPGVVGESKSQPSIAVGKLGLGFASGEPARTSYVVWGYALPDPAADKTSLAAVPPSEYPAGPMCFLPSDDCREQRLTFPVGETNCGKEQVCVDPDEEANKKFECHCKPPQTGALGMNKPAAACIVPPCAASPCPMGQECVNSDTPGSTTYTCKCVAPQTGVDVVNGAATCTDVADDCATSPCGADQECKDDKMAADTKFTCECKAPKVGAPGSNAPAAMCADPADDCATSPCGADQDCKDDGMAADTMFTCECKAPKTGTGMNAPAMCADPADDCATSPCGADQDCKDDGMAPDMKFTCECKAPKVGAPGTDAPAAMCADPGDDCATSPCGADQDCKDDGMAADTKFTCECKAPKVGAPGTDAPAAMCADPADDCATSPCGADQECKDDGMAADTKFTCECKAPLVGDPGVNGKAKCVENDCTATPGLCRSPTGKDNQECKDTDDSVNQKYTCICKTGKGQPGDSAPAKCDDCDVGKCPGQTCDDPDSSINDAYQCSCKPPFTGDVAHSKPATCIKLDCEPNPCGENAECQDHLAKDDLKYYCSCLHVSRVMRGDPAKDDAGCPAAPTPVPAPDDDGSFIMGLIIGLACALVACLLIFFLVWWCCLRDKQPSYEPYNDTPMVPMLSEELSPPPTPPAERSPTPEPEVPTPAPVVEPEPEAAIEMLDDKVEDYEEEEEEEEEEEMLDDTLSDVCPAPAHRVYSGYDINMPPELRAGSPHASSPGGPVPTHRVYSGRDINMSPELRASSPHASSPVGSPAW